MPYKALRGCVIVTAGSGEKDWNTNQISQWIKEASGTFERAVTESTTHLVITKKLWDTGGMIAQEAIRRQRQGQNISIVSFDWLDHCFTTKSKKKEKAYKFLVKDLSASGGKDDAGPRSHTGLLKELYLENTELTPAQQKLNEKKQAMEEALAKERAAEKEATRQQHLDTSHSLTELGQIFKRGAKKASTILLNSNHHIYQDVTGFYYDITLTKVDTARNTNERYNLVLQILESNAVPNTYAFSTSFSGTKIAQVTNVVVNVGANFSTAMRAFRNCFKEKTGVNWNDRLKTPKDRSRHDEPRNHMDKVGGYARDQLDVSNEAADIRFQNFQYYPPSYGAVGQLDTSALETSNEDQSTPQAGLHVTSGENGINTPDVANEHHAGTPVEAVFGPRDVEKLHEAQSVPNEVGETLDPMTAPFDFGEGVDFEESAEFERTVAHADEGDVEPTVEPQYGDGAEFMDLSSYSLPPQTSAEQTHSGLATTPQVSSLGKRKDSGVVDSAEHSKKRKIDVESGEYIIENTSEAGDQIGGD
ncbi:hypothetical protein CB0940_00869 [Cercospora beticola]|uniref:Uncharacterized protein n=1 Tax=Cercospora beticola TaxID=122368 RepID=A0A2G5I8F3_CERBT|nr:hypothetical protein CB0940_00869 [Cercospora beticola]PIB01060.1 hypothetical protein CB0940_00869 [Cercospora beticola]WPA96297.1 hypothetical protein RHO25_000903 [Cercospora beticola]CAK1355404.1 unnamed protein product [Cercospora beticola]